MIQRHIHVNPEDLLFDTTFEAPGDDFSYLQHEHYALWEVIEFGDSYVVPTYDKATDSASEGTATKKGRTVSLTTEDMQKRRNDAAILKTFGGNEATKKTKKNLLKQQYGNFKAEGKETLEKTFNRLHAIISQLEFMDVEIKQDDLNQKLLTSLSSEWLMHTIVWRNRSDLDTISLDDLYNHLKDINQIDEDDIEEMDIKWNMALPWSKVDEQTPKALMAIDGVGWDWSFMENKEENHALVADEEAPTEFALMAKTSANSEDLSWTCILEFVDDMVTDYSRPSPTIESTSDDAQNRNPSIPQIEASPSTISSKPFIKFVKAADHPTIALNANPTPSSDCKTKSSSTSLNSLLEGTNTFDNSLPEFETFCFDVEEISSGNTITHPDISLLEYEVFHDDHVKEISSGSPTTHSDSFLYASFIFDLSINPFPPADRSDSYEFTDELIPFISAPKYDCFFFKVEPNLRDFTKDVVEDISPTKEPQVLNTLPTHPTLQLNIKFQSSSEYLFTYVVWIFIPFLVYSVAPYYLLSLGNEDIIFDPGICKSSFSRPAISYRCGTVKKFNTHRSHLNKCPMLIHG
uniref:Uncharacterized protein n=1 Tax=Tanacetum cinerariifolium TaxID=118510 RepID=A0A6L2J216_TANCI|nr:hypothetical protein [Tanacetum cinerariifolium]